MTIKNKCGKFRKLKSGFFLLLLLLIIFVFSSSSVSARPLNCSDNPVSLWHLDENGGITAIDSCGTYNGTLYNNPTYVAGNFSYALKFDGVNDYVSANQQIVSSYPFSVSLWFKINGVNLSSNHILFGLVDKDVSNIRYRIGFNGSGNVFLNAQNVNGFTLWSPQSYNDGNYHYLVALFTGSTSKLLYIDNIYIGELTNSVSYSSAVDRWNMGREGTSSGYTYYFNGTLDEIAVFNRTLTTEEMTDYFTPLADDCSENWIAQYGNCGFCNGTWDGRIKTYYDNNTCNTTVDLPVNNGSCVYDCDYCSGFQAHNTSCLPSNQIITYYTVINYGTCCNVTNLSSDCDMPSNQTYSCSYQVYSLGDDYTITGLDTTFYTSYAGNFNEDLTTDFLVSATAQSELYFTPKIADFDNDGVKEIAVYDRTTYATPKIKIYGADFENQVFILEGTVTLPKSRSNGFSNMIVSNIDDNEYPEIVMTSVYDYDQRANFIEYNGTDYSYSYVNFSIYGYGSDELLFNIDDTEYNTNSPAFALGCYNDYCYSVSQDNRKYPVLVKFNKDNIINVTKDEQRRFEGYVPDCRVSMFPYVAFFDLNYNGNIETVFSMTCYKTGTTTHYGIVYKCGIDNLCNLSLSSNYGVTPSTTYTHDLTKFYNSVTSPLIANLDSSTANGQEIIIGYRTANRGFKMLQFDKDIDLIDDFPELTDLEGDTISNVFKLNYYSDTADDDFGFIIYELQDEQMYFAVSNINKLVTKDSYLIDIPSNVTKLSGMVHVFESDSNEYGHELLSSYGVYALRYNPITQTMVKIYDHELNPVSIIPFDVQYSNAELIGLTNTRLHLISDGTINKNARIKYVTINPCSIGQPLKNGTVMTIKATLIDYENDKVRARAYVYYNDNNEQVSDYSSFYTPVAEEGVEVTIPYTFSINKTGTNYIVRVEAQDIYEQTPTYVNWLFTVLDDGISYDESTCTITGNVEDDYFVSPLEQITNVTLTQNPITNALNEIQRVTNTPVLLIWLLIMLIVSGSILFAIHEKSGSMTMALISSFIFMFFMIVLGRLLEIIPMGVMLVLVIILIIPIALFVRKVFIEGG